MKIGFFYQYTTPGSERHLYIARHLIESTRKHMPGVEIVQFTDDVSETHPDVDDVRIIPGAIPMAVRRMMHHADVDGDWLFVDTDVVIQKDVRDVFNDPFDIAVTDRIGTEMEGTPYGNAMLYNMGVTFSRCPQFWAMATSTLQALIPKYQQWEGDQRVVCDMVRRSDRLGFKVKILPGRIYNFPPVGDEDLSHAAIVHYKGRARKQVLEAA